MLHQFPMTIPAEMRDFPEWRLGRETYSVWILRLEDKAIRDKFEAAREHLNGYLLEPYRRQPHITLFVCGFLVEAPQYEDDFTHAQLQSQIRALENSCIHPFEVEIGGLNSFASAPYLEVRDTQGGIARMREILANGAREIRTAPYTSHLTVGLYADKFDSREVTGRLAEFPANPLKWKVAHVTFSTYRAGEIAGRLTNRHDIAFIQE